MPPQVRGLLSLTAVTSGFGSKHLMQSPTNTSNSELLHLLAILSSTGSQSRESAWSIKDGVSPVKPTRR